MTVPVERSPRDVRYDMWMARFKGFLLVAVGFLSGTATMFGLGSRLYVGRQEFQTFVSNQTKLDDHNAQDLARFATKEDLKDHTDLGSHAGTAAAMVVIQTQLAAIQADLTWLKAERLAARQRSP